uniref:Neurotoxin LmNaTx16 n=1 Tax=Lychas mucronatus TaxID=172552 RepID=A0A0U1S7T6_LYCMC|nr:neurotoxin LmNaTx16 precursor [Lychas mucronatus]
MKKILVPEIILFCLFGISILRADIGNYPVVNKQSIYNRYVCWYPGRNEYCEELCKLHKVKSGYCRSTYRCFCEYLPLKDVYILSDIKESCESEVASAYSIEFDKK